MTRSDSPPVFRFAVGKAGTSSRQMGYMSRSEAVREEERGVLLYGFPPEVTDALDYDALRRNLISYAWVRDSAEQVHHRSRGEPRSHYRAVLSFAQDLPTGEIKRLGALWLEETFPHTRAALFVHRNTAHVHAHVWIDARTLEGKKLNLSSSLFYSLHTRWARLCERERSRTEALGLEQYEVSVLTQRDRDELTLGGVTHARHQTSPAERERDAAQHRAPASRRERTPRSGEPTPAYDIAPSRASAEATAQAVQDAHRLYEEAQRMAERTRENELKREQENARER